MRYGAAIHVHFKGSALVLLLGPESEGKVAVAVGLGFSNQLRSLGLDLLVGQQSQCVVGRSDCQRGDVLVRPIPVETHGHVGKLFQASGTKPST
jgi:hypothetical protein